jgi:putative endopeptidase
MSRLDQRNPYNTYHKFQLHELTGLCPGFKWDHFFDGMNVSSPGDLNIGQPAFFAGLDKLSREVPVEKWKSYLEWNWINGFAPYLSEDFVEHHFSFYGHTLSGKEVIQPRWKRAVQATNQALGMLVGKYYVEKHFPPTSKKRMLDLVRNLKRAMGQRIENLDWMTGQTKSKALEKLQRMKLKIGYPDKWKDYSQLEIREDSYALNILRSLAFEHAYNMSKIGKQVDPDEWGMSPQTVNAYYNPNLNEIVFPAAILQPPFFYPDGDDAVNYGAIGMIIGHEMTHGFDDQGRHFDADGNLTDWWTEEDSNNFKTRTQVLVDQFNGYAVLPDVNANGELTLGENIADLGGLSISLTAYLSTQPDPGADQDGLTGLQRFFIAYARVWANSIRQEEVLRRTREDVHSLGELRVNGPLPNLELFYEAFGVKPGDKMFIEPASRAHIW